MTRNTALTVASILAIVHLILACLYASITPYRTPGMLMGQRDPATGQRQQVPDVGAPDERQHVNYTLKLLEGEGIPVLDPKDPNLGENYQAHQPPLFYFLHAGWAKATGTDLESSDQGLRARALNAIIGAATVMGAFFLGLWAFRREDVGVVAAAFVALLPMNTALSGAVSNDPLLYCMCTWCLALCAKGVSQGFTTKLAVQAGVFAGWAVLTKTTGIAMFPVLLVSLWLARKAHPLKVAQIAAMFVPWGILVIPWFLRNKSVYGDPLALNAFNEAFKGSPQAAVFIDGFGAFAYWTDWVGWWTTRSFFGVFGYMDIFLNETGSPSTGPGNPNALYRMLLAMGVVVIGLWVVALRREEWKEHKPAHWLLGAFLLIVIVLFARFNAQYFQGQARYLFPAISVFGVGVAIAALTLGRGNLRVALAIVVVFLGGLNLYALSRLPEEFKRRTLSASLPVQTDSLVSNVLSGNGRITLRV